MVVMVKGYLLLPGARGGLWLMAIADDRMAMADDCMAWRGRVGYFMMWDMSHVVDKDLAHE